MQKHIWKLQIALFVESTGNRRKENGEVAERLNQEGLCNLGKVLYSFLTDFKVSRFYLSFRK